MSNDFWVTIGIALLVVWSFVWKGFALWKSARNGQSAWFVFILIINTAGILEILYIAFFQKKPVKV